MSRARRDAIQRLEAARSGKNRGLRGRAICRLFGQRRQIHIGEQAHRQRARNRSRRHHQKMRSPAAVFFDQSAPLLDPEALLLVDDRQRQARNPRAFLKQRVRADDDAGFALHNSRLRRPPNARRLRAGENLAAATERRQQSGKGLQVLRREYLRRRHQRGGEARFRRRRASQKSDDGFAAADIAVQQAAHLAPARQIGEYLVARARLSRRQSEWQRRLNLVRPRPARDNRRRAGARAFLPHRHLRRQRLVESQPPPRRVLSARECFLVFSRRIMQGRKRVGERGKTQRRAQIVRQRVG